MQWNCANCGESVTVASPLAAGQEPCPHCGRNLVEVEPPPTNESAEELESAPPVPEVRLPRSVLGKIMGSIVGGLLGGLMIPVLAQVPEAWVGEFVCELTGAFGGGFVGALFALAMVQNASKHKVRDSGGYKGLAGENRTRLMICIVIGAVLGLKIGTYLGKPSPISNFLGCVSGLFLGAILGGECGLIAGEALEPVREPVRRVTRPIEEDEEETEHEPS